MDTARPVRRPCLMPSAIVPIAPAAGFVSPVPAEVGPWWPWCQAIGCHADNGAEGDTSDDGAVVGAAIPGPVGPSWPAVKAPGPVEGPGAIETPVLDEVHSGFLGPCGIERMLGSLLRGTRWGPDQDRCGCRRSARCNDNTQRQRADPRCGLHVRLLSPSMPQARHGYRNPPSSQEPATHVPCRTRTMLPISRATRWLQNVRRQKIRRAVCHRPDTLKLLGISPFGLPPVELDRRFSASHLIQFEQYCRTRTTTLHGAEPCRFDTYR